MRSIRRLAAWTCIALVAGPASAPADPSALVQTAPARQGRLAPEVVCYGTVAADPAFATAIAVAHEAIVEAIFVRVGEIVAKGTALASLTTSPAAAAQYEQAASGARFAAGDLAHMRQLYAEQLATRSQLAQAEKADDDAKALLAQQQRIGANRTVETLRATGDGVVTEISVTRGQHVPSDTSIVSLGLRSRLVIDLGLEPAAASGTGPGAQVGLTAAQDPSLRFVGSLVAISALVDPQTRLVNATVRVPHVIAPRLLLGMTFSGRVRLAPREGVIVPRAALQADQDGTFVFVVARGVAHRRYVTVAVETNGEALIPVGLRSGESVVTNGSAGLEDGMAVRAN